MSTVRWFRPSDDPLRWETFGEANFVYHPASGQTHFLNQLGAWILESISANAQTEAEVVSGLLQAHVPNRPPICSNQ